MIMQYVVLIVNTIMLDDITIAIKTFLRPQKLDNCLNSIRKLYPGVKIIVADDSHKPVENKMADEYYTLRFDSGISAGRNLLLSKVTTPYILLLDDDTLFTQSDCIEKMIQPMLDQPEINLVAGSLVGNDYYGTYEKSGDTLIRYFNKPSRSIGHYKIYDFVINLFLAKTEAIRRVGWNDELKICEHTNFFFRGRDKLVCTVADDTSFVNDNNHGGCEYNIYRNDRRQLYIEKQFNSLDVVGFKDIQS